MKKVLAISGGVDSMVLLDIMGTHLLSQIRKQWQELETYGAARPQIAVATFDHGTRPSAEDDALFVNRISNEKYGLICFAGRGDLGEQAAEVEAREARYEFLRKIVRELNDSQKLMMKNPQQKLEQLPPALEDKTVIYTAHHLDDLVESIVINLLRGTGWRGLAALDAAGVRRPFLEPELMPEALQEMMPFDKKTIQSYAAACQVSYRQDPTNYEDNYLRNRVRRKLQKFPREKKLELYKLWQRQKKLKAEVDNLVDNLLPKVGQDWQRGWFRTLDNMEGQRVALELLRAGTRRAGIAATRPQLENFRRAIINYAPGKSFNLPGDVLVKMKKETFRL